MSNAIAPKSASLIMLHAAGSSPRALAALGQQLTPHVAQMVAPSMPLSVAPSLQSPLSGQIALVRETVAEALSPRLLFGHSFGGLVAVLALLEGVAVDVVVLYEPIVLDCLDDADAADRDARAWDRALIDAIDQGVARGDPEPAVRGFVEAYNEVAWERLPERARTAIIADADNLRALTQVVHHLPVDRAALARIDVPTLILSGTRSPAVARRMAMRLAAIMPRATRRVIEDTGHMGPVLLPEAVAASIAHWRSGQPMDTTHA